MIVTNLSNNHCRRIYCAIVIAVGAASIFAWHLVVNGKQQKWLFTLMAAKEENITEETSVSILEEELLEYSERRGLHKGSLKKVKFTGEIPKTTQEPFPRKILIISRGRSGSSFLGNLFNENKNAFYLFEPLASTQGAEDRDELSSEILEDLYDCKFRKRAYLRFLAREQTSFRKKSKKLSSFPGQCSRISRSAMRCLSEILTFACSTSSSIVAKVLTPRLPQGGLWGIRKMLDADQNLKIIHLLRDPRHVISSMKNAGWLKGNFSVGVRRACTPIWENIKHVQNEYTYYKERYKLLVFSDMMLDPFSTVQDLYTFLKMGQVPRNVFAWIAQNTMASSQKNSRKLRNPYGTFRNSTEVLNRKVDFTKDEDFIIDKYCNEVIKFIESVKERT